MAENKMKKEDLLYALETLDCSRNCPCCKYFDNNTQKCQDPTPYAVDLLEEFIQDVFNPQPYRFEDLKEGMWVYLKDNNELVLIDFTTYNPETGERFVYFWVVRHIGVVRFEFKENRFYPVYIVK